MIVLCRHGATDENVPGAFLSTRDPPLNPLGRAQCERARGALRDISFEVCLVSPTARCLQSRAIIAPALPFEVHGALREVDFGTWEGKTIEWLSLHDPDAVRRRLEDPVHFRPPSGESFADVAGRLRPLAAALASAEGNTLVIGHRGTLSVLERLLRRLPLTARDVAPLEPGEFRHL